MGASLLTVWWLLAAPARAQDCPDRLARLDMIEAAEQKLLEADLAGADLGLRSLEKALGCGSLAESDLLARMWLLEGAWLTLQGDPQAAVDSWRAAARVAPGRWVDAYGPELREAYDEAVAAPSPEETARIHLDPPLFRWIGAVDGHIQNFPARVEPGLHVVQVGPGEDDIRYARVLVAFPEAPSVVVTGLVEPTNAFDEASQPGDDGKPYKPPKDPIPPANLSLYTAVGSALALGRGVDGARGASAEPGVKLTLPLETGFTVRPGSRAFVRLAGTAALLVGGEFQFDDAHGAGHSPAAVGASLTGGAWSGLGDMGLLVGYQWPDRIPVRGVLAGRLPRFPLQVEGRLGMNAAFGRTPEPALDVVFALTPRLFRRSDGAE
ncbi:MAG: hypothetical protein R3F59_23385 [Myxococcota bacterium]